MTPREKLMAAAGKTEDDADFAQALNEYRDDLLAAAPSMDPQYCPYDCDHCHDDETCTCPNCVFWREDQ